MRPWQLALEVLAETIGVVDGHSEYAVFGSTVLKLNGVIDREPGDLDVFVSRRVWGAVLPHDGWEVLTPAPLDPPILSYKTGVGGFVHLFFAWRDDAVSIDVPRLLAEAELVEGRHVLQRPVRCCTVDEVLRHKLAAFAWGTPGTAKHGPDVEAIWRWQDARR